MAEEKIDYLDLPMPSVYIQPDDTIGARRASFDRRPEMMSCYLSSAHRGYFGSSRKVWIRGPSIGRRQILDNVVNEEPEPFCREDREGSYVNVRFKGKYNNTERVKNIDVHEGDYCNVNIRHHQQTTRKEHDITAERSLDKCEELNTFPAQMGVYTKAQTENEITPTDSDSSTKNKMRKKCCVFI